MLLNAVFYRAGRRGVFAIYAGPADKQKTNSVPYAIYGQLCVW